MGYGAQKAFPDAASWKEEASRTRYYATPKFIEINAGGSTGDFSMRLSNNPTTGGTCFGDSGGPNFLRDSTIVAGITSFGTNWNCAGTGGVFRTDRQGRADLHQLVLVGRSAGPNSRGCATTELCLRFVARGLPDSFPGVCDTAAALLGGGGRCIGSRSFGRVLGPADGGQLATVTRQPLDANCWPCCAKTPPHDTFHEATARRIFYER